MKDMRKNLYLYIDYLEKKKNIDIYFPDAEEYEAISEIIEDIKFGNYKLRLLIDSFIPDQRKNNIELVNIYINEEKIKEKTYIKK